MKIFMHQKETWDEAKCRKASRHINRDDLGTVVGPKGLINCDSSPYPRFGQTRIYNGGCIRNGEWFNGETIPLPIIPDTYRFRDISSWGTVIEEVQG